MIPTLRSLDAVMERVLQSVPEGLTRGDVAAGIYGVGFLGRWAVSQLKGRGIKLLSCYDADAALSGGAVDGVPVHAAADLKTRRPDFVFVTARHAVLPVSAMLSDLGIAHASYDAWYVASNFAAFRHVHDRLGDERSREVLRAVLMTMLTGDESYCAGVFERNQYFCLSQFCGTHREIYVDAGAFVGDSAERFIWTHNGVFSKIYAFEPSLRSFAALQTRTRRLIEEWALDPGSIELINAGLADDDRKMFAPGGNGQLPNFMLSHGGDGENVDVLSLDKYLDGGRITFLKADVEGMEMALLRGAQATIRHHRPKISICVYHYPTDIPEIANYLASLAPDYRFALRHHSPQFMETVLYCWAD